MISERLRGLLARHHNSLPMRVSHTMIAIGGYDRALALSAQAFGALVPLLLLVSLAVDNPGRAAAMAGGMGLSPSAAVTLGGLVAQPPPSTSLTVLGAVLLIVSVFGFIRALQRTFTAAWNLPSSGVRGYWRSLLASVTLVVEFALLVLLAPILAVVFGIAVVGLVVHTVTATLLWWPIQWVLLDGRVGWRRLLPGALITGLGQAVLVLVSGNPTALLLLVVFALLLLLVRGSTGLFTAPSGASAQDRRAIVLLAATGLPIIVAVTDIGTTTGDLPAAPASALVGAGMLSVLLFPLIALAQRRTSRSPDTDIALNDDIPDEA